MQYKSQTNYNKKIEHQALIDTIITTARVEKILNKLVDKGILAKDFGLQDMTTICKNLPSAVFYECLKKEPEAVNSIENFGKYCGAVSLRLAKKIVAER